MKNKHLEYFIWNCLQVNVTGPPWWLVNIGSDNGLVPSGIKPLFQPMLTKSYDKLYMTYTSFSEPYFFFYCNFWWWCDIMWTALWNWMNFRVFIYQTDSFLFGHHYLFLTETVGNICRADSRFAPSQWETALLCNDVSHWLGASLESALIWYMYLEELVQFDIPDHWGMINLIYISFFDSVHQFFYT